MKTDVTLRNRQKERERDWQIKRERELLKERERVIKWVWKRQREWKRKRHNKNWDRGQRLSDWERERERLMELCKRRYFHERKLWAVEFISFGRVESGKMRIADCARNYSGLWTEMRKLNPFCWDRILGKSFFVSFHFVFERGKHRFFKSDANNNFCCATWKVWPDWAIFVVSWT